MKQQSQSQKYRGNGGRPGRKGHRDLSVLPQDLREIADEIKPESQQHGHQHRKTGAAEPCVTHGEGGTHQHHGNQEQRSGQLRLVQNLIAFGAETGL